MGQNHIFNPLFRLKFGKTLLVKEILMCVIANFIGNFAGSKSSFKFEDQMSPMGGGGGDLGTINRILWGRGPKGVTLQKFVRSMVDFFMPMSKWQDL
jgi:hypothetical protein